MRKDSQTSVIERNSIDTNFIEECLAARELSGAEFKLYRYFCNFPLGMSIYKRSEYCKAMGAVIRTADLNFEALIEKGYLKFKEQGVYIFLTIPA